MRKMIEIKNAHFICNQMSAIDIAYAFGLERKAVKEYIYQKLIAGGYLHKKSDRWFKPTEKLLNLAFLPSKYTLSETQSRYLTSQTACAKEEMVSLFDGNAQIFKALVEMGYLKFGTDKRYRKSTTFEDMLVEGEDTIHFKREDA
jgi:hypothetical protein